MKRILILGNCGAGKSTLARQLHETLQLPVIHLDQHYWQAGWIESEKEVWEKRVQVLMEQEEWIMDGNYSGSLAYRLLFADTIILLNYNSYLCVFRVLKRYFLYKGRARPDMTANCPERLDWVFLRYVKNFRHNILPRTLEKLEHLKPHQHLLIFNTPKDTNSFLQSLQVVY